MNLSVSIFGEAQNITDIQQDITCCIYSQSSIVHLSLLYEEYVVQISGPSLAYDGRVLIGAKSNI